jgi:hypothetical protein
LHDLDIGRQQTEYLVEVAEAKRFIHLLDGLHGSTLHERLHLDLLEDRRPDQSASMQAFKALSSSSISFMPPSKASMGMAAGL